MTHVRTLVVAVIAAFALTAGGVAGSASAATASKTVTISGVVPAGARDDVTVAALPMTSAKGTTGKAGKAHRVNATTGAFSISVPKSSKRYTLFFNESDSAPWFDTYLGGVPGENGEQSDGIVSVKASASHHLGSVDILAAGVISGTLEDPAGKAVPDAQVWAQLPANDDDDWDFYGFSNKAGHYAVKVARDTAYDVFVIADDYQETYYPSAATKAEATAVTADAAHGYVVTGTTVTVPHALPSITGAFAHTNKARDYEAFIYALDPSGHPLSSIPAQSTEDAQNSFYFYDLPVGSYGIAFRDVSTGDWLPWKSYSGSKHVGAAKATKSNACLLPFSGSRGPIRNVGKILLGTSTCTQPFSGASFSGTVSNPHSGSAITASLFYVVPGSDPTPDDGYDNRDLRLVDHVVVGADGHYAMDAISAAGTYVAEFSASTKSPFLDTWQGGFLVNADGASTKAADAAPSVAVDSASGGNDVTMTAAGYITGTVTLKGKPVAGAKVVGEIPSDDIDSGIEQYLGQGYSPFEFATTNSHGAYSMKVPQGYGYALRASSGHHSGEYDNGATVTASAAGPVPGSFSIALK